MKQKITVTNYQNFCLFLQDYYCWRKQKNTKFSYASWARELGVSNRVYLRSIVLGERPLSEKLLNQFVQHLEFTKSDREYFINLVNYKQSKTLQQKQIFARNILKIKIAKEDFKDIAEHYDFLSDELLPVLLTLLSFDDVPHDTKVLGGILKVSVDRVAAALQKLSDLQLIKKESSELGRYVLQKRSWRAADSFKSIHLRDFYEAILGRAKNAIDTYDAKLRRYRALFVPLAAEEFDDFLKDFEVFAQEQLAKRNVDCLSGRRLYCLNFNFFPVSEVAERGTEV